MQSIVYLNSRKWRGFPPWFRPRFERAIRRGFFGRDFKRTRILETDVYRAANLVGYHFDHIGRAGNYLTNEPYRGRLVDEIGLRTFCEALNLDVEIGKSSYKTIGDIILHIFSPKGEL